jgi:tRNA pseudouridine32 synthase/23S rRNA pseudouridine746 synthase
MAIVATAVAFGLWHVVISFESVTNAGIDNVALGSLGYVLVLLGLTAAGAFFALLRWHTGSIVAPLALHWAFNSIGITAVWVRAQ